MPATISTDFVFEPLVWQDHIRAYFDRKLVLGAIALKNDELMSAPGTTTNFPFYRAIGAAEEPAETAALTVDNLSDDSFSATVREIGKAVGFTSKSFKVSAAKTEQNIMEATQQMGRVHAEKVDADILTEMQLPTSSVAVTATKGAGTANTGASIRAINEIKVKAFGDKHTDAMALQINSLDMLSIMNDTTAGFLQMDSNSPFFRTPGYQGTMLGLNVFEVDSIPAGSCFIHKVNPYGLIYKQEMELESDKDILARQWVFASTEWYAVKSFHAEVNALDLKSTKGTFA